MRSLVGSLITFVSTGLIVAGLYLSLPGPRGVEVIDSPGIPVRLTGQIAQAVAYFEEAEDGLELIMIFSEAATDGETLFKTRVRLSEGQSHSLSVGADGKDSVAERFTFVRVGRTIQMSVDPGVKVLSAGI